MMRIPTTIVLGLFACSAAIAQEGEPVETTAPPQAAPHYFVIAEGTNINVRTAASVEGGYPFFKVNGGVLIEVLYDKYGWSRIRTSTPIFKKAFGYVSAKALEIDGTTGTVNKRTALRAPNLMHAGLVESSWEGLDPALEPGTTLELIDLIPGATNDDPGAWKVRLPRTHQAWINTNWLRPATAEEITAANPEPLPATSNQDTADTTETFVVVTDTEVVTTTEIDTEDSVEEPTLTPEEEREAKLAALDDAFRAMLKEDLLSAELELLQQQFIQFSQDEETTELQRATAKSRADVLAIKIDVQDRLARLKSMMDRTRIDGENILATRVAMDFRAPFDIVGRLNASIVFNGKGTMPLLFRLQDPAGRHTIAYLVPDKHYDLAAMTGLLVGIVGSAEYDEALELNVIMPRRIDLVADPTRVTPAPKLKTIVPATPPAVVEADNNDGDAAE